MRVKQVSQQICCSLALLVHVHAFFRMPCNNRLISERIDPIVNPGTVSGHVHNIAGGSGIGPSSGYADMRASACTSCPIKEDLSAYWTPQLYYQYENGSFISVPNGGMTVYYLQRRGNNEKEQLYAFPEGFRMLSGTSSLRTFDASSRAQQAVNFVCLDYSRPNADGGSYTNAIPNRNCPDGLRLQVIFPSCWDGTNLDSADHKSHVSFPTGISTGSCDNPKFPKRLITLFYEVFYDVDNFKDMWYGAGHPFVLANGDPTGYGFHADFLNGWNVTVLQKAVDTCNAMSGSLDDCDAFTTSSPDRNAQCHKSPSVNEVVMDVVLPKLPGCNPVTNATTAAATCPNNVTPTIWSNTTGYYGDIVPPGYNDISGRSIVQSYKSWKYVGCHQDGNTRVFPSRFTSSAMTVESCLETCQSKGYTFGGLEYAQECWCGNSLAAPQISFESCSMTCVGNASEYCGGSMALTTYQLSAGLSSSAASPSKSTVVSTSRTSSNAAATATTTPATAKPSGPSIPQSAGVYNYTGCYLDSSNRILSQRMSSADGSTTSCAAACRQQGYSLFGVEYGGECSCDNSLASSASLRAEKDCSMTCKADASSLCGGSWAMQVYKTSLPPPTYDFSWSYTGCYTDSYTRTIRNKITANATIASCQSACQAKGYTIAGLENWGTECWCDSAIQSTGNPTTDKDCNQACDMDKSTMCGGSWRLSVFSAAQAKAQGTNTSPAAVQAAAVVAKSSSSLTTLPKTSSLPAKTSSSSTTSSSTSKASSSAKTTSSKPTSTTATPTASSSRKSSSMVVSSTTRK